MYIDINPLSRFFKKHKHFFLKHKDKFWWLHSIYALFFGLEKVLEKVPGNFQQ